MLSGQAALTLEHVQSGPCSCANTDARLQCHYASRCISSCSFLRMRSWAIRDVMLGMPRQQTLQRQQGTMHSSQTACAAILSRHSGLICRPGLCNVPSNSMLSSSSASTGVGHPSDACSRQPHRYQMDWNGPRRSIVARASLDATVQDVLMGSSVAIAIGMALYYGSKVMVPHAPRHISVSSKGGGPVKQENV
jgi:hypothetical protein